MAKWLRDDLSATTTIPRVAAAGGYPPDSSSPTEQAWRMTERFQFLAKPFSSEVLLFGGGGDLGREPGVGAPTLKRA